MAEVKVLIEGYAKEIKGGWLASSTTTLIKPSFALQTKGLRKGKKRGKNILVDPGTNRKLLLKKLEKEGLKPEDIDFVFMTHYHPDHNLLTGIFIKAKVLDDEMIYENDKQTNHEGIIPETDIRIIKTPGHEKFHGSLVVLTDKGVVVVAGDVFWWADNEKQKTDKTSLLSHKDPFIKDEEALLESRKKILAIADWVIPGHGRMFRNTRTNRTNKANKTDVHHNF